MIVKIRELQHVKHVSLSDVKNITHKTETKK